MTGYTRLTQVAGKENPSLEGTVIPAPAEVLLVFDGCLEGTQSIVLFKDVIPPSRHKTEQDPIPRLTFLILLSLGPHLMLSLFTSANKVHAQRSVSMVNQNHIKLTILAITAYSNICQLL